ncbi:peptidoglycan DD-metalloendopeptidase family protein [Sciscionella sediminilitoris]|uniref:peptidoglycan DD-metalloendopeptidase family protein n=1 Tax=Sciscionella sediminilitoris TaxID=1445613 RepID=UPI000569DC40|nr:peptidoglycan DD-metalloendopeptidase family protein [Sciscionella sp. SE31]
MPIRSSPPTRVHAAIAKLFAVVLFVPLLGLALAGPGKLVTASAHAATAAVGYGWPIAPPHPVVRGFDAPANPYGPGHRGVDLGATEGSRVSAAAGGVVAFAGPVAGHGVVSIQHADGMRTTYEPVAATVAKGDQVHGGQPIGTLRGGHDCGAPRVAACLHWGARYGETDYRDPLGLLSGGHVRLLPWYRP